MTGTTYKAHRWGTVVLTIMMLAGCSTQARRVHCDSRLTPINPSTSSHTPASAAKDAR